MSQKQLIPVTPDHVIVDFGFGTNANPFQALSLSDDGTILAVGAKKSNYQEAGGGAFISKVGVVVVYQLTDPNDWNSWSQMTFSGGSKFVAGTDANQRLGHEVQLSGDGSTLEILSKLNNEYTYYTLNANNNQWESTNDNQMIDSTNQEVQINYNGADVAATQAGTTAVHTAAGNAVVVHDVGVDEVEDENEEEVEVEIDEVEEEEEEEAEAGLSGDPFITPFF
jgi:hypothetical protein